jgi:phosphomannomutase
LLRVLYAEFGEFHYGRVDLDVKAGQKEKAIAYFADEKRKAIGNWPITRRENLDGIKVYLGDFGWLLVRASGTENLLRVYCETNDAKTTGSVLAAVKDIVSRL